MPATLTRLTVLPQARLGARPRMRRALPHVQLDQLPSGEALLELVKRCLSIPGVGSKQSRMATPGSHAFYLADASALGPADAFIDGHEFCHVYPLPEGSIHLTLPKILRDEVMRLGWGEVHPIAGAGILPSLLTIYGPRDARELAAVFGLVEQSCQFAQGKLQNLYEEEPPLRALR